MPINKDTITDLLITCGALPDSSGGAPSDDDSPGGASE